MVYALVRHMLQLIIRCLCYPKFIEYIYFSATKHLSQKKNFIEATLIYCLIKLENGIVIKILMNEYLIDSSIRNSSYYLRSD